MSVKASVASMALSGCPEAGALRCRPQVADRKLDAPQLQKLEEIVERAEGASLMQHGAEIAGVVVLQRTEQATPVRGLPGNFKVSFKEASRAGISGELQYKQTTTGTFSENRSFTWSTTERVAQLKLEARKFNAWCSCLGRYNGAGRAPVQLPPVPETVEPEAGDEPVAASEEMWTALKVGTVLAMGTVESNVGERTTQHKAFKTVYVAVRNPDQTIKAYEFDTTKAEKGYKVKEVRYVPDGANSAGKFYQL